MANFEYTRPGGIWADLVGLGADDLADLDRKTTLAISSEGGTYAPVTAIIVGGAGVNVTGPFRADDVADFYDVVTFHANAEFASVSASGIFRAGVLKAGTDFAAAPIDTKLLVGGKAQIDGILTLGGPLLSTYVQGVSDVLPALTLTGSASIQGNLGVGGTVTLSGGGLNVTVGPTDIGGAVIALGGLTPASRVTLRAAVVSDLYGRYNRRGQLLASALNLQTFSPAQMQWIHIASSFLSADTTMIISDSNCVDDEEFGISNTSSYLVAAQLPAGITFPVPANHWGIFKRFSGSWTRIMAGSFYAHTVAD